MLISLAPDLSYLFIIKAITNSKNLILNDEDELLDFVLSISQNNSQYEALFDNVYLEYCSVDIIKKFVTYLDKTLFKTNSSKSILNCIKRRILQPKIPYKEVPSDRTYLNKGILSYSYKNHNLIMTTNSSKSAGNIYSLFTLSDSAFYESENQLQSYIEASLKNQQSFIISSYMLRGHLYAGEENNRMQSWFLEGKRKSDGAWVQLDYQNQIILKQLEIRIFKPEISEVITKVKLIQNSNNTSGNHRLILSGFEIYGEILD